MTQAVVDLSCEARLVSNGLPRVALAAVMLTYLAAFSAHGQGASPVAPGTATGYTWRSVKIIDGREMPGLYFHPTQQGLMYIWANVGGAYRLDSSPEAVISRCEPISGALDWCDQLAAEPLWTPLTDWVDGAGYDWNLTGVESRARRRRSGGRQKVPKVPPRVTCPIASGSRWRPRLRGDARRLLYS
jgi:hypothetical protein